MQLHLFVHIELLHKETLLQILLYLILPKISCLKFSSRSVNHRGLLSHAKLDFHLFSCGSLFCWPGLDVCRTSPSPQGMTENLFPTEIILSPPQRKKNDFEKNMTSCKTSGMFQCRLCVYKGPCAGKTKRSHGKSFFHWCQDFNSESFSLPLLNYYKIVSL